MKLAFIPIFKYYTHNIIRHGTNIIYTCIYSSSKRLNNNLHTLVKLLHLGAIISRLVHGRLPTVPDLPLFLSPTVKMALKPASEILRYNLDFGGSILYNERHNRYIPTHKLYTERHENYIPTRKSK